MTSKLLRVIVFGTYAFLCVGFRTFDDRKTFDIDNRSNARTKIFIDYDQASITLENDLPTNDPLFNRTTITVADAMNSIFNDYNSIAAAYVQLVPVSDADFAAESTNRIITIRRGTTSGLSGGEAKLEFSGGVVVGCRIDVKPELYRKANIFIAAMTHEIGHCLGLDHPQETTNSVMSYFNQNISRLQIDDKMGITYLYPVDASRAAEQPTFGMSCARNP